jgi:hypothetical protein
MAQRISGPDDVGRDYDAVMSDLAELSKHTAVSVAAGAAATAVGGAATVYRTCEHLPVVGSLLRRGRADLAARGEQVIASAVEPLRGVVAEIAVRMVELILDEVELTDLVRERVDINAIAADFDVDAILARVDLIGLANHVIDGVDLPAIIRESTSGVTAEVMTDVRTQGERADDMVSGFFDRVLGRSQEPL